MLSTKPQARTSGTQVSQVLSILQHSMIRSFLLIGSRLVEVIPRPDDSKSKRMFHITGKGREFLHRYRNLIILLTAEKMPMPYLASLCRTQEIESLMES
jgi:hypothetical protein